MKQLIIDIAPDGATTIEAQGFKGKGCKKATEQIEAALGKAKAVRLKPEYHQTAAITTQQKAKA